MQLSYKKVGRCSQHRRKIFHFRSECSQVQPLSPSSRFLCWFQHEAPCESSLRLVLQVLCCTTLKPRNARCVSWCHLLPSEQKRDAYDSITVEFAKVHGSCDGFLSWVRKCVYLSPYDSTESLRRVATRNQYFSSLGITSLHQLQQCFMFFGSGSSQPRGNCSISFPSRMTGDTSPQRVVHRVYYRESSSSCEGLYWQRDIEGEIVLLDVLVDPKGALRW